MSKPKKNQQKGKSGVRLEDAILQYKLKNYSGALKRIRVADLKSGEEVKAKKLTYACLMRLALIDIEAANYQNVIKTLLPLTATDARAAAFVGVSYLYRLDFSSAIPFLHTAKATYPNFGFYYILGELYLNKYTDFEAFIAKYPDEWHTCTFNQKQYIQLLMFCFDNNQNAVVDIAQTLKPESHFQSINFGIFKSLLAQTPLSIETNVDKLKPLYRLAAFGYMNSDQKTYFQELSNTMPALTPFFQKANNVSAQLQQELEAQYTDNKLLHDGTLAAVMQSASMEQRPYIAYNQAVNAWKQQYIEDVEKGINHVIVKYADDFVQIPESLPLYLKLYEHPEMRPFPTTYWQIINQWLSVREGNTTVDNLDQMGWMIFDNIIKHPPLIQKDFSNIYLQYPSVFALKFAAITFPKSSPLSNKHKSVCLDLFSLPNAEKNKTQFIKNLEVILSMLSPYNGGFLSFLESVPHAVFIKQVADHAILFIDAVTLYKIPVHNSIALEAFKIINQNINLIIENNDKFPTDIKQKFIETYKNLILHFEPHLDVQVYKEDVSPSPKKRLLKNFGEMLVEKTSKTAFSNFLKAYPDDEFEVLWDDIDKKIDDTHFDFDIAINLVKFIEALYAHQKDEQKTIKEVYYFMDMYGYFFKNVKCSHPPRFYAKFVREIVKKKKLSPYFIYTIAVIHIKKLTEQHSNEKDNWTAVIDFLAFIADNELSKNKWFDKELAKKLVAFLTKVNRTNNIKGADEVLANKTLLS